MSGMNRIVTDNPQNNIEHMMNIAFVKDKEVWIRNGGEDGQDCTLVDFCRRMCAASGECAYESVPYEATDDMDTIGDILMDCSGEGCPIGTAYFAMVQAAELRERLRETDGE
ncbi:MAG: hypothetical protein IKN04_11845 [Clostridia bacterium]|nr:hypothetical protein [Clostridia bacterium]